MTYHRYSSYREAREKRRPGMTSDECVSYYRDVTRRAWLIMLDDWLRYHHD